MGPLAKVIGWLRSCWSSREKREGTKPVCTARQGGRMRLDSSDEVAVVEEKRSFRHRRVQSKPPRISIYVGADDPDLRMAFAALS